MIEFNKLVHASDTTKFATEILGFQPNPRQAEVLDLRAQRGIFCCSRGWGKSTTVAAKAVHHAIFRPDAFAIVIAPNLRQSAELLARMRRFLVRAGIEPKRDPAVKHSLALPQGQRILALPSNEDTVRGYSAVSLLIIDEAARVSDDVYHAVLPFLAATDGQLWLMSTPNGKNGFFYDEWISTDPENKAEAWLRIRSNADEAPHLKRSFLERQRASKPEAMFLEEYYCEFRDSDGQVFPTAHIHGAFTDAFDPIGRFRAETPKSTSLHYCIGVDLGKQRDYTAISMIELHTFYNDVNEFIRTGRQDQTTVRLRHLERVPLGTDYSDLVWKIKDIASLPGLENRCSVVVDSGGVGQAFVDFLRRASPRGHVMPVNITGGSVVSSAGSSYNVPKLEMLTTLQLLLELGVLQISSKLAEANRLKDELLSLRRDISANGETFAPARYNQHDDLVMATALAAWRARQRNPSIVTLRR